MPRKCINWSVKTPCAIVKCPACGRNLYVGINAPIITNKVTAWKCEEVKLSKTKKGGEPNGNSETSSE